MDKTIAICLLLCAFHSTIGDVDIITEPRPGEEYVLVSSGNQTPLRNFETSHKIPEKHPHHRIKPDEGNEKIIKKLYTGKVKHPTEGIVSIEEDKKGLLKKGQKTKESIEVDVPVSKIEDIKIRENVKDIDTNPKMAVDLEAMSESGKLTNNPGTTTQKPVLTTAGPATTKGYDYIPINFDTIDDINTGLLSSNVKLETAGSEQKHSRIQIKKGPNGQDYEYEYIYYYYDEEDEAKKEGKDKASVPTTTTTEAVVLNSHDGPAKVETDNHVAKDIRSRSKYSTIDRSSATTSAAPEVHNEVSSPRGRPRGRNVAPAPVEEESEEDRLPSSTRFPPRGRYLTATSTRAPELTSEVIRQRGRAQSDNVADESIGQTRSRTRSHIRRPSSELVDLDSFKTHSGDKPAPYKEQPTRYSSESRTTTDAAEVHTAKDLSHAKETQREGHSLSSGIRFQEIVDDSKLPSDYKHTTTYEQDTTEYTTMTAMEKVALDLYAYLAGENLNNEVNPSNDLLSFDGSTTVDDDSWTTEPMSTTEEETTLAATTTTTTTTTPAPTTTTTPATTTTTAAPTRPSRFKGRPGARARAPATSAATEAPQETSTRVRGRFGKPSAVRKTTATVAEVSTAASPAEKPAQPKVAFGRRGLFAGRTRPSSTTAAPAQDASSVATEVPAPRARLRPGLRRVTSTTSAASASAEVSETTAPSSSAASSGEVVDTTPIPSRTIGRKPGLRPVSLRPGPRLNLRPSPRLRPGLTSAATTESASEAPAPDTSAPEAPSTDAEAEGSSPAPVETGRVGLKIRNRLQVAPSPRPKVAVTSPPRRPNPLLKRKLTTEATTEAAKVSSETTEESTSAEKSETETEATPETTVAPLRGLDALFARRRAGARLPRPARRAGLY